MTHRFFLYGLLVVFAFLSATAPLAADDDPVTRRIERAYFAGEVEKVHVNVTFSALVVEGVADGRQAEVEVILRCDRADDDKCRRRAERIRLAPRIRGNKMVLKVKGTPRGEAGGIESEMRLKLPDHVALEIDMGGGDVSIQGMRNHVEVDSGGGSIDYFAKQDDIGSFKVDVGFGSGTLWLRESRVEASGWPRSITWKGTGHAKVEFDLGGGKITARLD